MHTQLHTTDVYTNTSNQIQILICNPTLQNNIPASVIYVLTDHKSLDHPISFNFLLLVPTALFSPVAIANALLHAANASTSSVILLAFTNTSVRSEPLSAITADSSMHSRRLSRERPVPAKCRALMYARMVSGRYASRICWRVSSPPELLAGTLHVEWRQNSLSMLGSSQRCNSGWTFSLVSLISSPTLFQNSRLTAGVL